MAPIPAGSRSPRFDCQQYLLEEALREAPAQETEGETTPAGGGLRSLLGRLFRRELTPVPLQTEHGFPGSVQLFKRQGRMGIFLWTAALFRGIIAHDPARQACSIS